MVIEVRLPKLGMSMESGVIKEWFAGNGDHVTEGQILYSVETDKSIVEVETQDSGILEIIGEIDEEYQIGDIIAKLR